MADNDRPGVLTIHQNVPTAERQASRTFATESRARGSEAVDIDHATGLATGRADGLPHPIEVDALGNLFSRDSYVIELLEQLLETNKRILDQLVLVTEEEPDDPDK